jgi:precorrin-6Y C5,15-methyltransferase (decarboxylating)
MHPVDLVGLHGGEWFGAAAGRAVAGAGILAGAPRHLDSVTRPEGATLVEIGGDLGPLLDQVTAWRGAGRRVCLLASGDPGFFGLARLARARLGAGAVRIHPAPSSVALAFARLGGHWDDAAVVSVHGRDAAPAVEAVLHHPKVAVLCSPATPPEELGRLLAEAGAGRREVAVASRLGEPGESRETGEPGETVWTGDVAGLAGGRFDPLSVVVLQVPERPAAMGWGWGLPESAYAHRGGMITKAEVRAVALGKLDLVPAGVMWDVGAGSGSVSAECARLAPGLRIYAVERRAGEVTGLLENLEGSAVTIVEGTAPEALAGLPDPDRAFVGGGGIEVLDAVLARLRPGGTVVATYASPGRAVEAAGRLGQMIQLSVSRAVPAGPDAALRLAAENPVFVCWGPAAS